MERTRDVTRLLARWAGALSTVAISLFAMVAHGGINQWTYLGPDGGWPNSLAWHPTRDGVLFATVGTRAHRSLDRGLSWTQVTTEFASGPFLFDPGNANRILVPGASAVLRSTDGGASFSLAPVQPGVSMSHLATTADGSAVYGVSGTRAYRTTDFAETWVEQSSGLPATNDYATALKISPADPQTIYISFGNGGLYKSTNGGSTWVRIAQLAGGVRGIAINPNNAQQLLAIYNGSLWRTNDSGSTWSATIGGNYDWIDFDPRVANRVLAHDYSNRRFIASIDGGGAWLPSIADPAGGTSLAALSPTTSGELAIGSSEGIHYSNDAGLSMSYRSNGLRVSDLYSIAASRTAPFRIYASFFPGPAGVYERVGSQWQSSNTTQLYSVLQPRDAISSIAVDPVNSSVLYAGNSRGLVTSADAGNTWTYLSDLFGSNFPYKIVVDPTNAQIIYVASGPLGILRSTNGGAIWSVRNSGLPADSGVVTMINLFVDPASPQRLYAIDNTNALYRTTDSGLNWTRVAGGLPSSEQVFTVAFDPLDATRLYIGTNSGAYRSLDGGVTWQPMVVPLNTAQVSSILIDPAKPGTVVLLSRGGNIGLVRTVDFGTTWERLPWNAPNENLQPSGMGILDPAQPGRLIVGTSANGSREFQIAPDMAVTLSGLTSPIPQGGVPVLRVTVQNKFSAQFASSDATVTLSLPTMLVPGAVTTTRGSCLRSGQSVTCQLGAMNVGETALIDVPLSASAGTGNVSASVQSYEADALTSDNIATLPVTVLPVADLRATLSAPMTVDRGSEATVAAQLENLGPHGALNAQLIFTLPLGLTVTSGFNGGGICSVNTVVVTCGLGSLPSGGNAEIQVPVTGAIIGLQNVSVSAGANSLDPDASNNAATVTISVRPVADLSIALSNVSAAVPANQNGTAAATITNNGPDPVSVAVATLSGTGLTVSAAAPNGGSCSITGGTANCSFGTLAGGASRTIDVSFTTTAPGVAQLTGSTSSEGVDRTTGNNATATTVIVLPVADLRSTLATPAAVDRGSSITLQAQLVNAGPHQASNARLVFALPAGLSVPSLTSSSAPCSVVGVTVTCQVGVLASGSTAVLDITATGTVVGPQTISVSATADSVDPNSANNVANATIAVRPVADLAITMSSPSQQVVAGQAVTVAATVTNNGPDALGVVTATLSPANLTLTAATHSGGSCSITNGTASCSLGALAVGASRTIDLTFSAPAAGPAQVNGSANSEGTDGNSGNNAVSVALTVSNPPSPPPPSNGGGSGGGGGAMNLLELWFLGLILFCMGGRERLRRTREASLPRHLDSGHFPVSMTAPS